MNKDEIKGKVEKAKGYIKEEAGEALGDRDLEERGRSERQAGKVREAFGTAKRKVEEIVDEVRDEIDEKVDRLRDKSA